MASRPPRRSAAGRLSRQRLTGLLAAAVLVLAGCATLPTTSAVQQETVGSQKQGQNAPELIPAPPRPGLEPQATVLGFLFASASFADNYHIAREYLTSGLAWHPTGGAMVVSNAKVTLSVTPPPGNSAGTTATVLLTAQRLARLTGSGQYVPSPSSHRSKLLFGLVLVGSQWRINKVPNLHGLILQKADFERTYLARNLYFYSPAAGSAAASGGAGQRSRLVPDPVYVPQAGANAASPQIPALSMVRALRAPPSAGPLAGSGTSTALPPGTTVLGVTVGGTLATVDLGPAAAKASPQRLKEMAAQIAWTLTSSSYSPSAISSVAIQVNHVTKTKLLLGTDFAGVAPALPAGQLYYLHRNRVWQLDSGHAKQLPWLAGSGSPPITQIAVQPGGSQIAGMLSLHHGCQVYVGPADRKSGIQPIRLAGSCSSLSFDSQGNLWIVAGRKAWYLPEGSRSPFPAVTGLPPADSLVALRIAPDGTRVAVLSRESHGQGQLWLGAIQNGQIDRRPGAPTPISIGGNSMLRIGTDVPDPRSLAWYDADHLMVLSGGGDGQLYEVPVNGGSSTRVEGPPDGVLANMGATRPGQQNGRAPALAVAISGQIQVSEGTTATGIAEWKQVASGLAPVFPG